MGKIRFDSAGPNRGSTSSYGRIDNYQGYERSLNKNNGHYSYSDIWFPQNYMASSIHPSASDYNCMMDKIKFI